QPARRRLAASRLADDAERPAFLDREAHPGHRLDRAELSLEQPGAQRKLLDEVGDLEDWFAHRPPPSSAVRSRVLSGGRSSAKWQADRWPSPTRRSSGGSVAHGVGSTRSAQRGWNAQPGGTAISDGGCPSILLRRSSRRPSTRGSDASRPRVYG